MLVYRSLVLGLLGACVMLLAQRPVAYIHVAAPSSERAMLAAPPSNTQPTIIDLSTSLCADGSCDAIQLLSLLHLAPDERVVALQDAPKVAGNYIDLTVSSPRGERRVLVLMH
jgi:hypothetical protein